MLDMATVTIAHGITTTCTAALKVSDKIESLSQRLIFGNDFLLKFLDENEWKIWDAANKAWDDSYDSCESCKLILSYSQMLF